MRFALLFVLLWFSADALGQTGGIRTYCNPLDIDYKYNFEQKNQGISYRSGADPVIIRHKDAYYLFGTIAGGYWRSTDLVKWDFIEPSRWPFRDVVAPAALSVGDTLYLLPSWDRQGALLYTTAPETGKLEFYNRLLPDLPPVVPYNTGAWDPALFYDEETRRWFNYFGSSNVYPIFGVELDPSNGLAHMGEPVPLIYLHPEDHGWERFGQDHTDPRDPFIEGAWMTKHEGRYYLQYAAPGTEYNVYANGTYVGDDPLGPFEYAPYNPVSYKPGGFVTGAGHGNTFEDEYGNFWNTGTPWVAVNWNFERSIAMFPAGFDTDGQMFASTRFGDFPHYAPTGRWESPDELFTGWMLLSYRKPATASSVRDTFAVERVTDENPRTFWVAETKSPNEWLTVDLEEPHEIRAIQVNFTDYQAGLYASDSTVYTQFRLKVSEDGETWRTVADLTGERRDRPNAYVELPEPVRARYVRYEHVYVAAAHLAISDLRVFGNGDGGPPATPTGFTVRRDTDPRNAFVTWEPVEGAVGYNVRWGIAPDKLYLTYQVFADAPTELEIRALNRGVGYHFAVEAFNENGVSALSEVVSVE